MAVGAVNPESVMTSAAKKDARDRRRFIPTSKEHNYPGTGFKDTPAPIYKEKPPRVFP